MREISGSELFRLQAMAFCEKRLKAEGFTRIAGVDEAGRGPLAGPVVAAACILPPGLFIEGVYDSKTLTPAQRERLYARLTQDPAIYYSIASVDASIIDQ